jgi:hypothetical protein
MLVCRVFPYEYIKDWWEWLECCKYAFLILDVLGEKLRILLKKKAHNADF